MPPKEMSQADQTLMRDWAHEYGKAVRQRTVRQCTTKHDAGTLPLNMYEKELPIGERVTFENGDQDSEYDSGSDEEERESAENQGEDSLDLNAINFLSRSIRTRSGRVISLSHRALASYQKTYTFLNDPQLLHFYACDLGLVAGFWIFSARPPNPATIRFGTSYILLQQYHRNIQQMVLHT